VDDHASEAARVNGDENGGWRLEAGGWRLEAGGWRLEAGMVSSRPTLASSL
jgi:hypothetical protein